MTPSPGDPRNSCEQVDAYANPGGRAADSSSNLTPEFFALRLAAGMSVLSSGVWEVGSPLLLDDDVHAAVPTLERFRDAGIIRSPDRWPHDASNLHGHVGAGLRRSGVSAAGRTLLAAHIFLPRLIRA